MSDIKYAMVIDQRRCTGCHSCVIACKSENNVPDGLSLNVVLTEGSDIVDLPAGSTPMGQTCSLAEFNRETGTLRMDYLTRACQHCEDAPCVAVCPSAATWQREDGIVTMDPTLCLGRGCELCMKECPYGYGTMRVLIENPTYVPPFPTGDQEAVESIDNTVKKCTFCEHRVERGEQPFCVAQCPARARFFGDINNKGSEVYSLVHSRGREVKFIEVEQGRPATTPSVYFLKP